MTLGNALKYIAIVSIIIALAIVYPAYLKLGSEQGLSTFQSLVTVNSFFTIWTNIFVLLVLLSHLGWGGKLGSFFRRPVVVATAVAAYLIVMIVYHVLLSAIHNPEGWDAFSNLLRHYVGPIVFALWWFVDGRSGSLRWADLPWLPLYPTIYLAYAFIRGMMTGTYPYPFLNLQEKGIAGVAPTVLAILVLFLITGLILIYLDRRKSVQ